MEETEEKTGHTPIANLSVNDLLQRMDKVYRRKLGIEERRIVARFSNFRDSEDIDGETAARLLLEIFRLDGPLDELLAVCRETVEYFDALDADADFDDPLVAARRRVHGPRIERMRAAIAKATSK